MKPDILCFPVIDWRFRYQRPQQILSRLARRGHRVFYIETTFTPTGSFPLVSAEAERNLAVRPLAENVWSVTLTASSSLNLYKDAISSGRLLSSLFSSLCALRKQQHIGEALLLAHLPFWRPLVEAYRRRFGGVLVYDCMDNHRGFSTNTARMCDEEDALVEMADLVLVSAEFLFRQFSHVDKKTVLVRNGTEFLHFHEAQPTSALAQLSHPIIGYYGAISEWFDAELIAAAARQRPEWRFVLIGDTFGANLKPLDGLGNVHLLGEKPYAELPSYLQCFDVCCIPFHLTELTRATDPVKFYEYLSAGKPVVATRLPELFPFSDFLYFAAGAAEFIEKIEQALRENNRDRVDRRLALARAHDWDSRVEVIEQKIAGLQKKVSIIILTYNNLAYTKLCLESLYLHSLYDNWEVIIVDNHSTDDTPSYLTEFAASHGNVRLILNQENFGFARGNNQGIAAANGDIIILLNNDVVVTKGWLTKMVAYLAWPEVGLIGVVTNEIANEAKVDLGYKELAQMPQAAANYMHAHQGQYFEIKVLAAFCVGIRREVLDKVGLLDERFEVGMFEDDDFSRRVREQGYRIVCARDIFIHHFGGASFFKLPRDEYVHIFEANKSRFEEKWGEPWEPHRPAES